MKNRRDFLKKSALGGAALLTGASGVLRGEESKLETTKNTSSLSLSKVKPVVLSTWNHGAAANQTAWSILSNDGNALDAVEKGVRVVESDPDCLSVGLGGLPDRDGIVTLDACIMDHHSNCGSVAFLQDIENPISVARKVMENTKHVMLVGQGAYQFAMSQGFERTNLLTEKGKKAWERWKKKAEYSPIINSENHDTIGMIALDSHGNLSGACTTSGMAYKMHGRVGDSPLIGSGLFVDNEIGAACATGLGEAIIRVSGSSMVVELMRQGKSPTEACKEVVQRIVEKHKNLDKLQAGFLAINKNGEYGGASVYKGFNYAVTTETQNELVNTYYQID